MALALEGAPSGVTGTFSPNPATGTTSTLTLDVLPGTNPGPYTLTVKGTASGLPDQTVTFGLTVGVAGGYTLSAQNLTVPQGSAGGTTITIARTGGNASNVTLALEGAPTGVTGTFTPSPTTGNSSTLNLTLTNAVEIRSYTLTVRGTAEGLSPQTTTFTLTVNAPGNFTLAASPSSFTVQAGSGTVASTINITRTNGFAGAVAFTHTTTAPAGVTIAFSPTSTTGNSVTMNITVGSGVPAGPYTITVKGNAAGLAEQTATVNLTVTAAGGGGSGNISWTFCPQTGVPTWLAVQDGSGAWTRVTPTTSGLRRTFSFTITTKGGVAWVELDDSDGSADLSLMYGTTAELTNAGPHDCAGSGAVKTVNGTVSTLGATANATINLGGGSAFVNPPTTAWSIPNVSDGTVDLIASRAAINLANPLAGQVTDALILRRNLNPAAGSTLPVLNFDGAEKITPQTPALTITNPSGTMTATSIFQTANGETGLLGNSLVSASPSTYVAVPAASRIAGDLHILVASSSTTAGTSGDYRSISKIFSGSAAQSLTFGSIAPTVTYSNSITAPYLRPRAQFTNTAEYADLILLTWANGSGRENSANVIIWEGWTTSLAVDYTLPDFSAVAGWSNLWGLETVELQTGMSVTGWTTGGGPGQQPSADGSVSFTAGRYNNPSSIAIRGAPRRP